MTQTQEPARLQVLAISAHPDDSEIGCGGTLARLAASGVSVGALHLTRGELGTRGSQEQRTHEASAAAEALGLLWHGFLDCGDGALRTGQAEEEELIRVLRAAQPEVVLAPPPRDRHPDHGRAWRLVRDACYYAGLKNRAPATGVAHRPSLLLSYMLHDSFEPTMVVDVSSAWPKKLAAMAAYESQLFDPSKKADGEDGGAATKISSREFHDAVVGRSHHFGMLVGAKNGEPFLAHGPLSAENPLSKLLLMNGS